MLLAWLSQPSMAEQPWTISHVQCCLQVSRTSLNNPERRLRTVLRHTCELRWLDVQKISEGCPKTVLDVPPDTKSHLHTGKSQDYPGTSLMGSSGHQVTLVYRDVQGLSWYVPRGISQGCPSTWSSPLFPTVPDIPLCLDSPGTCPTLVGNTGHPLTEGQSTMFPILAHLWLVHGNHIQLLFDFLCC